MIKADAPKLIENPDLADRIFEITCGNPPKQAVAAKIVEIQSSRIKFIPV